VLGTTKTKISLSYLDRSNASLSSSTFNRSHLPFSSHSTLNMANQQEAGKKDPLTGMAHSEAHYFNR